jgi:hypothetical protein
MSRCQRIAYARKWKRCFKFEKKPWQDKDYPAKADVNLYFSWLMAKSPLGCVAQGFFYLDVGMANSAPLEMLSGQRCMMDFWRV